MVDFDLKYNLIGVLPRESSFILPIVLTMNIKNEKLKQLNDYYKAGFNHELCLNKRQMIFEQVNQLILIIKLNSKLFCWKVIELVDKYNGEIVSDYTLQNLCEDALLDLDI